MQQLQDNIQSIELKLSDEVLEQIDAIQQSIPNPCP
jgi:aryl-alcohol dehydrogenase-like predicted oxidoreductase